LRDVNIAHVFNILRLVNRQRVLLALLSLIKGSIAILTAVALRDLDGVFWAARCIAEDFVELALKLLLLILLLDACLGHGSIVERAAGHLRVGCPCHAGHVHVRVIQLAHWLVERLACLECLSHRRHARVH